MQFIWYLPTHVVDGLPSEITLTTTDTGLTLPIFNLPSYFHCVTMCITWKILNVGICFWLSQIVRNCFAETRVLCNTITFKIVGFFYFEFAGIIGFRTITSLNGKIFRVTGHLCGQFTGPQWIPRQRHGTLIISFICARINCWVNNREAGDSRRHRTHYDVIVMGTSCHWTMSHWKPSIIHNYFLVCYEYMTPVCCFR